MIPRRLGLICCLVFLWAACAIAGEENAHRGQRFEKAIQPMVRSINAGNYANIRQDFDNEMSAAFPLEKSTEFFKDLVKQHGKIVRLDPPHVIRPDEAMFIASFERGALEIKVVLDKRDKITGLLFLPHVPSPPPDQKGPSDEICPVSGDQAVTDVLKPIRQKHHVPAIAGLVLTSKGIEACGVVGVRKRGTEIPATVNDQWHLGSCTKAMTATLIGTLVEQDKLKWDTTVSDVFPDLASAFHPEAKDITVAELLSHHAGLPGRLSWRKLSKYGTLQKQRLEAVRQALSEKPASKPGREFSYSNLGYVVAGAIIERVTGMPWEKAIERRVFKPLEMHSAGFGGVGTPGKIDQPWGHNSNGQPVAKNGPSVDNSPVMGPAGTVHCTIQDWSKFVADQLRGARGEQPTFLRTATYQTLGTPPFGDGYGLGWSVTKRSWGGGTVLHHCGSNTMNHVNVWVAPKRDFAVLVCINQDETTAFSASNEAVVALIKRHASKNRQNAR